MKHLYKSFYTKVNLYSSAMKLLKLVYAPPGVSFLKTFVLNLSLNLSFNIEKTKGANFSFKRKVYVFIFLIK